VRYDIAAGRATTVFEEEVTSFLDLNHSLYRSMGANVRLLAGGRRAITFSQRDGWGHLYLVDLEGGNDIRQLTRGEWVVHDIVAVDEREDDGFVYFTAGGREPGRNPYWRHVYRVPLEGNAEIELLTPEPADHAVTVASPALIGAASTFSPSKRYFVSNSSTVDSPPVSRLHRSDGSVVTILEQADASELFARGYEPPQPFTVKAADGHTDLYGVLWRPKNFDEDRKYPVIEHIYGGPQTNVVPRNFNSAAGIERIGGQGDFSTFTALGFAVVTVDARGTTSSRSRITSPRSSSSESASRGSTWSASASAATPGAATPRRSPCFAIPSSTRSLCRPGRRTTTATSTPRSSNGRAGPSTKTAVDSRRTPPRGR